MSATPTVTEARAWSPDSLTDAADGWDLAAVNLQTQVDGVVVGVDSTVDFWTGSAAETMREHAGAVTAAGTAVAQSLHAAATAARDGAVRIDEDRTAVLLLVDTATGFGCTVADDGTVTPPAVPPAAVLASANGNVAVATAALDAWCAQCSIDIGAALDTLGATDAEVAAQIDLAFDTPAAAAVTAPTGTTGWTIPPADLVAGWSTLSQDRIAAQIAGLTEDQRKQLIEKFPLQVGNTDGIPWDMRMAANRINITNEIAEQQHLLGTTDDDEAIAARISFYESLLEKVDDPTGQSATQIDRQIIAFDPERSSFIELTGNLDSANHIGVFVPGANTSILESDDETGTSRRFVEAGKGDVAMLTYLGGPFPSNVLPQAAFPHYATDMAPRLVSFAENVNSVADTLGPDVSVTVIGHSYGGSILGTAESMGLTADRTLYVAAAGAGVGVDDPSDWHPGNPDVVRYAMTAPGDVIEWAQGIYMSEGPHGADPDEMEGVIRLATGDYADGRLLAGPASHSDIINAKSEAWDNILAVITGSDTTTYREPLVPNYYEPGDVLQYPFFPLFGLPVPALLGMLE